MQITVTATENDAGATAALESPADADPLTDDYQVNLSEGANDITIKVTAANGSTRTYTVTVTRTGPGHVAHTGSQRSQRTVLRRKADYTLTFQGGWTD